MSGNQLKYLLLTACITLSLHVSSQEVSTDSILLDRSGVVRQHLHIAGAIDSLILQSVSDSIMADQNSVVRIDTNLITGVNGTDDEARLTVRQKDSIIVAGYEVKQPDFTPVPRRATLLALIPGGGQIYNRKYWKLPIVYGGFVGCVYALTWNGQMYSDYKQAYLDIMDDDDNTSSYEDFLPPNFDYSANLDWLESVLKNRKDKYRRYRDMSIFAFAGVYLVSIIDAYVDAELSHFDISDDLSMKVSPGLLDTRMCSLGVNLTFDF